MVFDDRQTMGILDWMDVEKHHAEELSGKH